MADGSGGKKQGKKLTDETRAQWRGYLDDRVKAWRALEAAEAVVRAEEKERRAEAAHEIAVARQEVDEASEVLKSGHEPAPEPQTTLFGGPNSVTFTGPSGTPVSLPQAPAEVAPGPLTEAAIEATAEKSKKAKPSDAEAEALVFAEWDRLGSAGAARSVATVARATKVPAERVREILAKSGKLA